MCHNKTNIQFFIMGRWNDEFCVTEVTTHVLIQYRYMLDTLMPDQVCLNYIHTLFLLTFIFIFLRIYVKE